MSLPKSLHISSPCILALFGGLFFSSILHADTFLDIYGASKHFNKLNPSGEFTERNYGLGLTRDLSSWESGSVGAYRNSMDRPAVIALYTIKHQLFKYLAIGGQFGFATGYDIPIAPVVAPILSIGGDAKVNIGAAPRMEGVEASVIYFSLQVKI